MTRGAVLTGKHFMHGDDACAEGALAAGCRFFGGYPITPSTEVAERLATRFPEVGGVFIQMEDELGSIASIIGASAAGVRSMTATSGPGLSLMTGILGGVHFGMAVIVMARSGVVLEKIGGGFYALDLLGAAVGVLVASLFIIPIYGILNMLLFLSAIAVISLLTLLRSPWNT